MRYCFNRKPVPKARPRLGRWGVYDSQKDLAAEFKDDAMEQNPDRGDSSLPVCFSMRVGVPMPNSWSIEKKTLSLGGPAESRPDLDNYLKWYMDVLNGIAYVDDKLITQVFAEKVWSYDGKVEVDIQPHRMKTISEICRIKEDVSILGDSAVKMHLALDNIYTLAISYNSGPPKGKSKDIFVTQVIDQCLEGGLDEIY